MGEPAATPAHPQVRRLKLKTVVRNAHVLVMDAADTELATATVVVDGDRIAHVGAAVAESGDREIDARGQLLMPGLINGHFHSSVNDLKGSLDSLPLEIFMLFESPASRAAVEPRTAYIRTLLGALEMLRGGVTCVLDDAFFVPHPTPPVIDAVMQAYADCGIRATLALDQPNVPEIDKLPFLRELLPPQLLARASQPAPMASDGLLACYQHLIRHWHGQAGGRLRAAVSCSAPQRVTRDYFEALDDLSRRDNLPFYVHVLETRLQRVLGQENFGGRSLIQYVHQMGLLSERLNIIHGIWIDAADMDLIAAAGSVIAHNPISNLRLGSGIMPFRQLRQRGIPICLGTDEAIADDAASLWGVAKVAGLIHNLSDPDYAQWPVASEVLDCLIRGGARAARSPQPLGQIAAGYQADLVMLDLDTLSFTPLNDLRRQLVYCENGSSVKLTMVAGRIVFENGRVNGIDEAAVRAEAREIAERARRDSSDAEAQEWLPYYRQMYLQAARRDVGMNRWAGEGRLND
jgi:5-methylthioadenosine/S-adenosylhomocysteine deaminase